MEDDVLDVKGEESKESATESNPFEEGDWRHEAGDPRLKKFTSSKDLAKAYFELESWKGSQNKVVKLDKDATPEEQAKYIRDVLNLPKKYEDYKTSSEVSEELKKLAYSKGILPQQLDALVKAQADELKGLSDLEASEADKQKREVFEKYKQEVGVNWNSTVKTAQEATRAFIDDDMNEEFQTLGLNSNPAFIKLLSKVGAELRSDSAILNSEAVSSHRRTAEEIQIEIEGLMGRPEYKQYNTPQQKALSQRILKLHEDLEKIESQKKPAA